MIKKTIRAIFRRAGYEIHKIEFIPDEFFKGKIDIAHVPIPLPLEPVWPLPRLSGGFTDDQIKDEFGKHKWWYYSYEFEGGLSFPVCHTKSGSLPKTPLQRFKHFMPYLVQSCNGSLRGKRILDISCNSGFWSIQCALLGAEVVGFDARPELIAQANMIKAVVGIDNVQFKVMDFWQMTPQSLHGMFDAVLNMGVLSHLSDPFEVLLRTKTMSKKCILLDSGVFPSENPFIRLKWEVPVGIATAKDPGVISYPTKRSIDFLLRHLGVAEWFEIPVRNKDIPRSYCENRRATWLIQV
jgi:2-polyprenyl-3-methyl-5-hydroxy-6-metoxy-1,4-benzoquinol methylase